MSDPKVQGVVHFIDETKTYGQNGFRKRLLVLEQDKGRFTNYVPVEFTHEGCDSVDRVSIGDEIEITYRLSGRKWQPQGSNETKYFLNAEALEFRIVKAKSGNVPDSGSDAAPDFEAANNAFAEIDEDDVPF